MKKTAVLLAALTLTALCISVTACDNSSEEKAVTAAAPAVTDYPQTEEEAAAVNTEADTETAAETSQENKRLFGGVQDNTKIDLFSDLIHDDQGKEYEVKAYIYHVDNGDADNSIFPIKEGMIRGRVAAELLYGGERVCDMEIVVKGIGQVAKSYYIPKIADNFKVLHLDDGDVFVCSYSDDDDLWVNQYYTVRDGELKVMNRYFSDEEKKQIEDNTRRLGICPSTAAYELITPNKFTIEGNRLIYELEFDTTGLRAYSYEEGNYPAGEIPLLFDFENNTVKCEKDEYSGMVYHSYDVD